MCRLEVKKLDNTYISVFDSELDIISSLQSLQITLELAVVKENLLHNIGPLNESKRLLKDNTWFNITAINLPLKMGDPGRVSNSKVRLVKYLYFI